MTGKTAFLKPKAPEQSEMPGSERSFGLVFGFVLGAVGLWPLLHGHSPRIWAMLPAVIFVVVALARPPLLRPLNLVWWSIGRLLHRITTPIILGMLFYLTVAPTGLLMRAFGKDPLRLKFDRGAPSYWVERSPPGPAPDSMRNQF